MISFIDISVILFHLIHVISCGCLRDINVYGPGWDDPSLVLPSRYFFIQYPGKCTERISKVVIESKSNRNGCRIKQQVFHDTLYKVGLTVVRYRLFDKVCENGLRITLSDEEGREIKRKETDQVVVDEECSCRQSNFNERMNCDLKPELYQRINDDLRLVFT